MFRAKLILDRLDKDGKLLERREQPSKSFVIQFIDMLYSRHAQIDRAAKDITNTSRILDFNPTANRNLMVASTPGHAGFGKGSMYIYDVEGQDIGIQVGKGATAATPNDYKMDDRINHGSCGKSGTPAAIDNPSFETGDLTNWTAASSANMQAVVESGAWALKDGTYFCALESTGAGPAGEYAQASQDIDLTNMTHIRFQLRGEGSYASFFHFEVLVDGHPVYRRTLANDTDYPNQLADVCVYTGTHTVTFKCISDGVMQAYYVDNGAWIDKIEGIIDDPEIEYGGTEIIWLHFGTLDHNGEFTIRRYFTNSTDVSITINEVGIQAMGYDTGNDCWAFLIARDVVSPGVAVAAGEMLRVTYVPQITV